MGSFIDGCPVCFPSPVPPEAGATTSCICKSDPSTAAFPTATLFLAFIAAMSLGRVPAVAATVAFDAHVAVVALAALAETSVAAASPAPAALAVDAARNHEPQ